MPSRVRDEGMNLKLCSQPFPQLSCPGAGPAALHRRARPGHPADLHGPRDHQAAPPAPSGLGSTQTAFPGSRDLWVGKEEGWLGSLCSSRACTHTCAARPGCLETGNFTLLKVADVAERLEGSQLISRHPCLPGAPQPPPFEANGALSVQSPHPFLHLSEPPSPCSTQGLLV